MCETIQKLIYQYIISYDLQITLIQRPIYFCFITLNVVRLYQNDIEFNNCFIVQTNRWVFE